MSSNNPVEALSEVWKDMEFLENATHTFICGSQQTVFQGVKSILWLCVEKQKEIWVSRYYAVICKVNKQFHMDWHVNRSNICQLINFFKFLETDNLFVQQVMRRRWIYQMPTEICSSPFVKSNIFQALFATLKVMKCCTYEMWTFSSAMKQRRVIGRLSKDYLGKIPKQQDNSRYGANILGPLFLWQCFLSVYFY